MHFLCTFIVVKDVGTINDFIKKVWYDPEAHVNIFGFKDMEDQYRVIYDLVQEDSFNIQLNDKERIKFKESPRGLYYYSLPTDYLELSSSEY